MRVVTSNIKCNPTMPQAHVTADIRRVAELGDVIFWQEIEIPRYKDAVRDLAPGKTWNLGTEVPITLDLENWDVLNWHTRLLHRGRAHASPDRKVSSVCAVRHDGLKVAFQNTHYLSGAWNRKLKLHKQWRRDMWEVSWHKQRQWIGELVADGFTVIGGGDFNRVAVKRFHDRQRTLVQAGIDHLFVVPAHGIDVALLDTDRVGDLHTDHAARVAHLVLHNRRANHPVYHTKAGVR